jgi:uroporphyrinogen III methyltransferase / synthase
MDALRGRRIVVTRAAEQAEGLCHALEARGAHAIRCPTIRLAAPERWHDLDRALERLADYDWVVFTSANGVRFTADRMEAVGLGGGRLREARVAAVGGRTARALAERGVEAAFVSPDEGVVPLTELLDPVEGAAVLLARSDRADPVAARILRRRGARLVDDVVAYRTVPSAPEGEALAELRRGIDGIVFTSPSTVRGFLDIGPEWRRLVGDAIVATIGPTTTAAVRDAGLVAHEAEEKTMTSMVEALSKGIARQLGGGHGTRESAE